MKCLLFVHFCGDTLKNCTECAHRCCQNVYKYKWIIVHYSKSYVQKINLPNSVRHSLVARASCNLVWLHPEVDTFPKQTLELQFPHRSLEGTYNSPTAPWRAPTIHPPLPGVTYNSSTAPWRHLQFVHRPQGVDIAKAENPWHWNLKQTPSLGNKILLANLQ